jgi:hypothetical protein
VFKRVLRTLFFKKLSPSLFKGGGLRGWVSLKMRDSPKNQKSPERK